MPLYVGAGVLGLRVSLNDQAAGGHNLDWSLRLLDRALVGTG